MKRLYPYIPVFLFLLIFLLDKIFLLKPVTFLTQKDPTFLYYRYKEEVLDNFGEFLPADDKKFLIIIGSSRLMFIDYEEFLFHFPEWDLFNFSVPVNSPAYYLYVLEKIFKHTAVPDLVILETDPFQFNEFSPGFRKSNLPYTFDLAFVIRYFSLFERDDVSAFLGYMLFAGKRYPPDFQLLWHRWRNPEDPLYRLMFIMDSYQRKNRGCAYPPIPDKEWYQRDLAELVMSAEGNIEWLYRDYKFSEKQWEFFKKALSLLEEKRIPYLLVKPQVSYVMEVLLQDKEKTQTAYKLWKGKLEERKVLDKLIDFSRDTRFYCNSFFDAVHTSIGCYNFMLDEILATYKKIYEK